MSLTKLDLIRQAAKTLAKARAHLTDRVTRLNVIVDFAHRRHLPGIRTAVACVADCQSGLQAALTISPELFTKPRSITEAGIKCGYQAHDASIELPSKAADKAALVLAIKKEFTAKEIETLGLLQSVEVPVGDKLLEHCTPKQLARLGIAYHPAADRILIKPTDSAVDKIVASLLKAATDDTEEKAAA